MSLIKEIIDANIIKFGQFTLKSGQQSNMYFDFKKIVSHPRLLMRISYELSKLINYYNKDNTILCGVPMGAIPYATIVSTITNIPSIMIRDSTKTYGLQNLIEGEYVNYITNKTKDCILIEDVVTTGMSVIETIKKLEANGIMVKQIIVILDRGGLDNIKNLGYNVVSLLDINSILEYQNNHLDNQLIHNKLIINNWSTKILDIANKKKSNLIVSIDLDDPIEILNIVDDIGPYIVGIKLHMDIITFHYGDHNTIDYDMFTTYLKEYKTKYNFMVIEDRKFADISSIVVKQYVNLKDIADIVTVHCITGELMVKSLDDLNVGLLLIHQLSTKNNLINTLYTIQVEEIATKCNNLVGFIGQNKVSDSYLTFTPGVNIDSNGDNLDQQYNSPEKLSSNGCNFFIVGRGIINSRSIINSNNIIEKCKLYQERCWNVFQYITI